MILLFLHTGRSYYAAVGGGFSPYVKARMKGIISEKGFDCTLHDLSHDMVLISLQGPARFVCIIRITLL